MVIGLARGFAGQDFCVERALTGGREEEEESEVRARGVANFCEYFWSSKA
jgi:hypothetical protein